MLLIISQFVPTWKWCVDDNMIMSCTVKVIFHKGRFNYA